MLPACSELLGILEEAQRGVSLAHLCPLPWALNGAGQGVGLAWPCPYQDPQKVASCLQEHGVTWQATGTGRGPQEVCWSLLLT